MRILVVDDHPILRLGVRQLVEREWPQAQVVEAETIEAACTQVAERAFDAVVLDLVMPDVSGHDGVERMLAVVGATPILVLSFGAESAAAARLLQLGVAGYLQKDQAGEALITALRQVLSGRRYVTDSMADLLVGLLGGKTPSMQPHERLSSQEHRVMVALAAGRAPAEIASTLGISARTVGTYRARIFEKTGWKSNVELAKYCVLNGIADRR